LSVPKYGGIFVEAPATLNVRDIFLVGSSSSFVPMGNPSQIQVNVQVRWHVWANYSVFNGRIFAPRAHLRLGSRVIATGHMVAQRLTTDSNPQVFTCGDGTVDAVSSAIPASERRPGVSWRLRTARPTGRMHVRRRHDDDHEQHDVDHPDDHDYGDDRHDAAGDLPHNHHDARVDQHDH